MQKLSLLALLIVPGLAFAGQPPAPIPEPSTIALFASAAAAVGFVGYLRKKRSK